VWRIVSVALALYSSSAIAIGCSIAVQDILFSPYDVFAAIANTTSAEVIIDCPKGQSVSVSFSAGNGGGSAADRRMVSATRQDRLSYNLFLDPAMTQVWGDGTFGALFSDRVESRRRLRVYAQIYPGQDVHVGAYVDVVRVVILP
jgi:spore coat protein U-like protein